jgi:hypothetical protein
MKRIRMIGLVSALALALISGGRAQDQSRSKTDYGPIVGTWNLEVDAGEESYFLTLELRLNEGKLEGGLSEVSGLFSNAALSNLEFDGEALKFDAAVPTPPDGAQRLIKTEARLADDKLQGTVTIPEFQLSVPLVGIKK